jgi:hypothetical protein
MTRFIAYLAVCVSASILTVLLAGRLHDMTSVALNGLLGLHLGSLGVMMIREHGRAKRAQIMKRMILRRTREGSWSKDS